MGHTSVEKTKANEEGNKKKRVLALFSLRKGQQLQAFAGKSSDSSAVTSNS